MKNIAISEDVKHYYEALRQKLAFNISILFAIIYTILSYAYYFDSLQSFLMMIFGALTCVVGFFLVVFKKKYQFVLLMYSTFGLFGTSWALLIFHETVHLVDVLWMLSAVSLAYFSVGRKYGIFLLLVSLGVIAYFMLFSLNTHIETVKPRTDYQKFALIAELSSGFLLNFYLFNLFVNVYKYSMAKMREANEQLLEQNYRIKLQNDEKTTLVKEIHHRVKNNLQIVVSLLRLQSMELKDENVKVHFQESINRVMSMALIHQKLYQNDSLSRVKFSEYANDLMQTILSTDAYDRDIFFDIDSEIDRVELKSLIPIGLILNELMSNSLKHAFDPSVATEKYISLKVEKFDSDKELIKMTYKDSGQWKKNNKNGSSFGLVLVETLVEQLDGGYKVERSEQGTQYEFILQNINELDAIEQ